MEWRHFLRIATGLPIYPGHVIGSLTGARYVREWNVRMARGSGPYRVEEVEANSSIRLSRRADYWARDTPLKRRMFNFKHRLDPP